LDEGATGRAIRTKQDGEADCPVSADDPYLYLYRISVIERYDYRGDAVFENVAEEALPSSRTLD
jgi:hypothetical protein